MAAERRSVSGGMAARGEGGGLARKIDCLNITSGQLLLFGGSAAPSGLFAPGLRRARLPSRPYRCAWRTDTPHPPDESLGRPRLRGQRPKGLTARHAEAQRGRSVRLVRAVPEGAVFQIFAPPRKGCRALTFERGTSAQPSLQRAQSVFQFAQVELAALTVRRISWRGATPFASGRHPTAGLVARGGKGRALAGNFPTSFES